MSSRKPSRAGWRRGLFWSKIGGDHRPILPLPTSQNGRARLTPAASCPGVALRSRRSFRSPRPFRGQALACRRPRASCHRRRCARPLGGGLQANAIARTCVVQAALLGERTDEERGGAEKGSPTLVAARGTRGAGARVTFGAVSTLIAEAKWPLSGPRICMCRTASASSSRARRSGPESIGCRPPSESQLHDLGLALLVIAGQEDV
jgi:hypothetical protein